MNLIISSLVLFFSTNIDDILLLMMWFSTRKTFSERKNVFIGQFIGFTFILIFSLLGVYTATYFPRHLIGLLGIIPIAIGIKELFTLIQREESQTTTKENVIENQKNWFYDTVGIALITFSNGGDNIGIYVPSFFSLSVSNLILLIVIFYVLLASFCFLALLLVNIPSFSVFIKRYVIKIIPFILIGIGCLVLYKNGTISFLFQKMNIII